ncbi:unnamed protein product [Rotaria magnacalcarata]|uniref:MULE transposase domain-containing protein n=1 Tax=Rotaria magnacalcarata TaxID=392030 RepID=A0A820CXH3_9BILA|nr:unnamed protein product [Rotaria magnacalcarata]
MLQQLEEEPERLQMDFVPNQITTDFEKALVKPLREQFSGSRHTGCFFHFCQAIYREIRELGLTNTYKDDANARNFCRRLMALPVLPLHELFHGPRTLGDETEIIANEAMINYYRDHQSFYASIQNFVLHLHVHYANQYRLHGSLSNLGTFGQESLLGHFAKNRHGTHHFGELITNNYNVDFTIHNQPNSHSSSRTIEIDELFDIHESSISGALHECHNALCSCDKIDQCISIYRRCRLKHMVYHSLLYRRRGSSVSYFVQYSKGHDDNLFGKIDLFFKCNNKNFALIHNHRLKRLFTDYFLSSNYHDILLKALNVYFYVLHHTSTLTDVVTVDNISNMCVVFTFNDSLVVTPLSSSYEHD